jgi:hypothetical protein
VRKFNFLASGLVTATVLAGLGVNAVGAAPKINTESGESCLVKIDDKLSIAYPPGTTMTFKDSDGKSETYTCDGNTGNWVKTSRLVPTRILAARGSQPLTTAIR